MRQPEFRMKEQDVLARLEMLESEVATLGAVLAILPNVDDMPPPNLCGATKTAASGLERQIPRSDRQDAQSIPVGQYIELWVDEMQSLRHSLEKTD